MCLKTRFAFALLALVSAAMAFSAPPPNDNFADRIMITLDRLPPDSLAKITDFIYFVRKRALEPERFAEQLHELSLRTDLKTMSRVETAHLENEFEGYDQRYPRL